MAPDLAGPGTLASAPDAAAVLAGMAARSCNLSMRPFGDCVVAMAQGSLNYALKLHLSRLGEPEFTICYVAGPNGAPVAIDLASLKGKAKGADPFAVPVGADPARNTDLQSLRAAGFMGGLRGTVGLPKGLDARTLEVLQLGAAGGPVTLALPCSQMTVVVLGSSGPAAWVVQSQTDEAPWLYTVSLDLKISAPDDATPVSAAMQARIAARQTLKPRQIVFDFATAKVTASPALAFLPAGSPLGAALRGDVVAQYAGAIRTKGMPVLGGALVAEGGLPDATSPTGCDVVVSPVVGGVSAGGTPSLVSICTMAGNKRDGLPPLWNWMSVGETAQAHGVMALSRTTLAGILRTQLDPLVRTNCYAPHVKVGHDSLKPTFDYSLQSGQLPAVATLPAGDVALLYKYGSSSSDESGHDGLLGKMEVTTSLEVDVKFSGQAITVTQHLVIGVNISVDSDKGSGNVVDKTVTDVYALHVDAYGKLVTTQTSLPVLDKSQTPGTNKFLSFFNGLNELAAQVARWAQNVTATRLTDLPLGFVQDIMFPGGSSFVFRDVCFSEGGDLLAHITYADIT